MTNSSALLVKVRGNGQAFTQTLAAGACGERRSGIHGSSACHGISASPLAAAVAFQDIEAVEPDLEQRWEMHAERQGIDPAFAAADRCQFENQSPKDGRATGPGLAWHLRDEFSGLSEARRQVGNKQREFRIAHLDTGFDSAHVTKPQGPRVDLQRNFMRGEQANDASNQTPPGMSWKRNRGPGAATLALLAGGGFTALPQEWEGTCAPILANALIGFITLHLGATARLFRLSNPHEGRVRKYESVSMSSASS